MYEGQDQANGPLLMHVGGRLDADNALILEKDLEKAVHTGDLHIQLDMGDVSYLSSAGLRVLLKFSQILKNYSGSFFVVNASSMVRNVVEMTGMAKLLLDRDGAPAGEPQEETFSAAEDFIDRRLDDLTCSLFRLGHDGHMECTFEGHPERLHHCAFSYRDHHAINCTDELVSIGLGTLGPDQEDFHRRCGEFLAVNGIAMYQPTDGGSIPDYMQSSGQLIPRLHAAYSICLRGKPWWCLRFEARNYHVTLSKLLQTVYRLIEDKSFALVMLAQSDGLIGATLKQPPFDNLSDFFSFPSIRRRLYFSPEHVACRQLALVAGMASKETNHPGLQSFTRPWGDDIQGHFHAAVFDNRLLPQGRLELTPTLLHLFQDRWPQQIIHLINDDREISGAGNSLFIKGALWFAPLTLNTSEKSANSDEDEL